MLRAILLLPLIGGASTHPAPLLAQSSAVAGPASTVEELPGTLEELASRASTPRSLPTVLEGRVLSPAGAPARGAVVVSSAGGQTVTDREGSFSLQLELPDTARSVQVTAVGSGGGAGQIASTTVPLSSPGGAVPAGTLELTVGAGCEPSWLPTFGGLPGTSHQVMALIAHDDGQGEGPALYVGGELRSAGGVEASAIAKWDGSSWSPVGDGMAILGYIDIPRVMALAVYDDGTGSGPALYAGGVFTHAGWAPASHLAKWDGTSWSAVGGGMDLPVHALAVHDDGTGGGPALYAGGYFATAGGIAASRIAKWDGSSWSPLGSGLGGEPAHTRGVWALAEHDDGTGGGPSLYAGGKFETAGGVQARCVAKWDGAAWSSLGAGMSNEDPWAPEPTVEAFAVYDDGSGGGPKLVAGGIFSHAGASAAANIAQWDGASWSGLGSGASGSVYALRAYVDGGTPTLLAGGAFTTIGGVPASRVARWNGSSWSALGGTINSTVRDLASWDDGSGAGPVLFAGGSFTIAEGIPVSHITKLDGTSWSPLGHGMTARVRALAVYDDGQAGGPGLFAAGDFVIVDGAPVSRIARWNGTSWSTLGSGINGAVWILDVYDDGLGGGPALFAAGPFSIAGGVAANRIAKWDGSSWSPVGSGVNASLRAMAVYDDGTSGPELIVGGHITEAGGVAANHIAKWNGSTFSPLGTGMSGGGPLTRVASLAVYDDGAGSGPALYAGGKFASAGGVPARNVAKWDGSVWSPLASGIDGTATDSDIWALAVYDDGQGGGEALYAAGVFPGAGGTPNTQNIARWDGTAWSPLGSGISHTVYALAVHDDGTGGGPSLYAAGTMHSAGGVEVRRIAKWDGVSWSALGSGIPHFPSNAGVDALAVHDDGMGTGPALVVAGAFTASPAGDSYIARWGGCASTEVGQGYCAGDGSASPCPCDNPGGPGEGCANSGGAGALLAGEGSASVGANDLVLSSAQLPPAQSALLFVGEMTVNGGLGSAFGDGLRCATGNVVRLGVQNSGPSGFVAWGPGLAGQAGHAAGQTVHFQVWYRDNNGSPCGSSFNLSNGLAVDLSP